MKAWEFTGSHKPLSLVELPEPVPGDNEIALNVHAAGLCHTDIGFMEGALEQYLGKCPIVLGHEIAGIVTAVGGHVSRFKVGDRVAIKAGSNTPGVTTDGAYADMTVAREELVCAIPDNVSFVQAAAATDAGMTAYNALVNVGQLAPGQRVGIIGIGGLGGVAMQIAIAMGAKVYCVDPKPDVHKFVSQFPVEACVADIAELAGQNLDLVVDYAGFGTTTAGALDAVKFGGIISVAGVGVTHANIDTGKLVGMSLTLKGTHAGSLDDVKRVLEMISNGQVHIQTTEIGFDDIPEGLEKLRAGKAAGRLVAVMEQG